MAESLDGELLDFLEQGFARVHAEVAGLSTKITKVESGLRAHVDQEVQQLREDLREATKPITPDTGETLIAGMKVGRTEKIVFGVVTTVTASLFASLLGLLIWVGKGMADQQAQTALQVAEIDAEIARVHADIALLEQFAAAGGRATAQDLSSVARCVLFRFDERASGLKSGEPLSRPNPQEQAQIDECRASLRLLVDELAKR